MENIREGVFITQAINDFSDEYMVPIDSESFKTPSLIPHTLLNFNLNFFFILLFENFFDTKNVSIWWKKKNKSWTSTFK